MDKKLIASIFKKREGQIQRILEILEEERELDTIQIIDLLDYPFDQVLGDFVLERLINIEKRLGRIENCCKSNGETKDLMEMLIAQREGQESKEQVRKKGLEGIRSFTKSAEELIIIDPYIFGGATEDAEKYIEEFKKATRMDNQSVKKVHIIYDSNCSRTQKIKRGIKNLASDNNCYLTSYDSQKLHDRIWIKDKKEAIIVGTSFGGIGNKISFILDLPDEDLNSLLDCIQKEQMYSSKFE